jgi:hypothetical protein
MRFAWEHGVREPGPLADVAALLLVGAREVAHEEDKTRDELDGRERIQEPVIRDDTLVSFAVQGSMNPGVVEVEVDLKTFTRVKPAPVR